MKLFGRKFRTNIPDNQLARVLFSSLSNGSIVWSDHNNDAYIKAHNTNADLWAVIDYIVNGFNKVGLVVKNAKGDVVEKGPLFDLITHPNPGQSTDEFMAQYLKYKKVVGNSYIFTPRLTGGRFIEMHVVPAQGMEIVTGGWMQPVRGYSFESGRLRKEFPAEEILHCRETNLSFEDDSYLYGMSPLKAGGHVTDTNTMAQEASAHRFKNRGAEVIMTAKGDDNVTMSQATLNDLKNKVRKQIAGTAKEGEIVMTDLKVELHRLGVSAVDLGIFDGLKMTRHQLCNLYHIPPKLMDPTVASTYNNGREDEKSYYKNAVIPEVQQFCTAFNRHIGGAFGGEYIDYDTSHIESLQMDYEAMVRWMDRAPMSINERRVMLGLDPVSGKEYDEVLIPMNLVPVVDEMPDFEPIKNVQDYR